MLKEEHQQFDVIQQHQLPHLKERLGQYRTILLPHLAQVDGETIDLLAELQQQGISIVATSKLDARIVQKLFSAKALDNGVHTHSAYLETKGPIMKSFDRKGRIALEGGISEIEFAPETKTALSFMTPAIYGPPERSGGHKETQLAGVGIIEKGSSSHAYLPWEVGRLYYTLGFEDYKHAFFDVMGEIGPRINC